MAKLVKAQFLVCADIACSVELQELGDLVLQTSLHGPNSLFQGEQSLFQEKIRSVIKSRYLILEDKAHKGRNRPATASTTNEFRNSFGQAHTDADSQQADHANDYNYDYLLYPGRMGIKDLKYCPPTCMFTSEFDFLRGDAMYFIQKLKNAGRYLNHQDMPGVHHGFQAANIPESNQFYDELAQAFKMYIKN